MMCFMSEPDECTILIRWKTGRMQVSLAALVQLDSSWFSKAKKLLKLSEESDLYFHTKNHPVWIRFLKSCKGISDADKRKLQQLCTFFQNQKKRAKVLF